MQSLDAGAGGSISFSHGVQWATAREAPVLEFELAALNERGERSGSLTTGLTVDSGAAVSVLDGNLARVLGIDIADSRYPRQRGVGIHRGAGLHFVEVNLLILICDRWLEVPVLFCRDPVPVPSLLGRRGIFDRVSIGFRHKPGALLAVVG